MRIKFGLIREGKVPPDARVPLTPEQARALREDPRIDLVVQPAPGRCFKDREYQQAGVPLVHSLENRDILLGVKEVPVPQLIPGKTYCFFSHTIKAQPYNRNLLKAVLKKKIRLIDYEVLTDDQGRRLIAFGRFAGMVGAHNALWTYGQRSGAFQLPRIKDCYDYAEARTIYKSIEWPPLRVVLTGTGRVGMGAAEVLQDMGFRKLPAAEFLGPGHAGPVFTQLDVADYARRKDDMPFRLEDYFRDPSPFRIDFSAFTRRADILINGIFWDNRAPTFFTREEMRSPDWHIEVIADITCDIAPDSSIPSTLRASTIEDPVFGFDPASGAETKPFQPTAIDVMSIDNLPNELPRDASEAFGQQFIQHILPEFFKKESSILQRATIAEKGRLGEHFQYLVDYVNA